MNRNTIVTLSVVAVAAAAALIVGLRAPRRARVEESTETRLADLAHAAPSGGRRTTRRDPHADGHATPAGGLGRVDGAPAYFTHEN